MTGEWTTLMSVRADAHLEVAPDEANLSYTIDALENDKAAALRTLRQRIAAATGALRDLGGTVRGAGEQQRALAWLVRSLRTDAEQRWDDKQGRHVLTGKISANATLIVLARDFDLLDRVDAALARHEQLHLRSVNWLVDHDNPGWQQVRAAAADAAVVKARDYATALGGTLLRVEHVADVGLLGESGGEFRGGPPPGVVMAAAAATYSSEDENGPSLDPVPQDLHASIEARFTAALGPLS